ncbi:hypothetical protein OAJ77_00125 [Rhodospirillales bacterium]|nr:hypothetical protein [Rhodospirillales bacterium]
MATSGPSNRYPDVGGELNTNQSATISSGVAEIKTFPKSNGPLILKVAIAPQQGGAAGQACFSSFIDEVNDY